jgi:hypothetical protein
MLMQEELVHTNSSPEDMASATSKVWSQDLLQPRNLTNWNKPRKNVDILFEEALLCYEKMPLLLSRYNLLGEEYWQVAEALVKIGRVMEYTYP